MGADNQCIPYLIDSILHCEEYTSNTECKKCLQGYKRVSATQCQNLS